MNIFLKRKGLPSTNSPDCMLNQRTQTELRLNNEIKKSYATLIKPKVTQGKG